MSRARQWSRMMSVVIALAVLSGVVAAQTSLNIARVGNFGKGEGDVRSVFAAGSLVYYSIANPKLIQAFDLITEVMQESMDTRARTTEPRAEEDAS